MLATEELEQDAEKVGAGATGAAYRWSCDWDWNWDLRDGTGWSLQGTEC